MVIIKKHLQSTLHEGADQVYPHKLILKGQFFSLWKKIFIDRFLPKNLLLIQIDEIDTGFDLYNFFLVSPDVFFYLKIWKKLFSGPWNGFHLTLFVVKKCFKLTFNECMLNLGHQHFFKIVFLYYKYFKTKKTNFGVPEFFHINPNGPKNSLKYSLK